MWYGSCSQLTASESRLTMIYDTNTVSSRNLGTFTSALNGLIENYQAQGLEVEVQYRPVADSAGPEHNALVIARKASE